jgi:hypothetical protein
VEGSTLPADGKSLSRSSSISIDDTHVVGLGEPVTLFAHLPSSFRSPCLFQWFKDSKPLGHATVSCQLPQPPPALSTCFWVLTRAPLR